MIRRLILTAALLFGSAPAWAVNVEKVVSPGGIEAWLVQDRTNPIISVEIAFKGGASAESKPGTAEMTASLLDEGAGPLDSQAFQGKLDDLSIMLSFDAGKDELRGSLKTLTENRDAAFDMLRLALTQPRFDSEPVERIRAQILAGLAREKANPGAQASKAWYKAAFGDHPYGRPTSGDEYDVKAIKTEDLRAYSKSWISRQDMVIGVVGDVTPQDLGMLLDRSLGALPAAHPPLNVTETKPAGAGRIVVVERDIPQSVAVFGLPGLKRDDPDWHAAYVMNYILGGGGFSSRLTEEVREKNGLAYSVYSYLAPMDHAGMLIGGVATQNAKIAQSLDLIRAEFRRMAESGPDAQELADAKTYLTGSFPLSLESTSAIAGLLVAMQSDRLGIDYLNRRNDLIEAVNLEQVKNAARRLLKDDQLLIVVAGKPQGIASTP